MRNKEYLDILNRIIQNKKVSFQKELIPLVSEFLTDINCENSEKMINFIIQNPQLASFTLPTLLKHFSQKYSFNSVLLNNKILCYYETSSTNI